MIDRLRESRWTYVLLSVLLALVFWMYVRSAVNPARDGTIYNVPIQFAGERVLEERGLAIATISQDTVNVKVNAPVTVLGDLGRGGMTASVDVSQCLEPGSYDLAYVPKLPTSIDTTGAYFPEQASQTVTVVVDRLVTKTMNVELQLEGNVADGYQAGTPVLDPGTVEVRGTQEQVDQIARVAAILKVDDLNENYEGKLPLTMLDKHGKEVVESNAKLSDDSVYVTLAVGVMKEVKLTVNFVPGGGATQEDVAHYEIYPKTITVVGAEEELEGLTEISLGSINLSNVVGTASLTMPISLSPTLESLEGVTDATVTVKMDEELKTKAFQVTNIEVNNVPSGYIADLKTTERTVVVRGSESALEALDASQIRIVADLSGVTATGTINVDKVDVYLNAGNEIGVVGTYSIVVNVRK